ncbi:hypothetical protein [Corallococcus sp. 4LFB]|uniref:hypothetical protein n=1 Tax=Corallococcus sp. 4LFB TaxID=3383249 RepID=UPI0039752FBC
MLSLDPRFDYSCEPQAQSYLIANLTSAERVGVTWTWYIGGQPGGGEESLLGGGAPSRKSTGTQGIGPDYCYITYSNYPTGQFVMGTGPQCGTTQTACTVACQNPETCQVNGAWVTDAAQCGTLVGPCGEGSGPKLYNSCRDAAHGLAPDADCGAGFVEGQAPGGSTLAQVQAQAARSGRRPAARARPSMTRPSPARSAAAPSRCPRRS